MPFIYATCLVVLGCWSSYATARTCREHDSWHRHRPFLILEIVFVAACFLPAVALFVQSFERWMILPLGVCYIGLLRYPCYFAWVDRGRVRTVRNLLFLVLGCFLIAVGVGWIPLQWIGL